MPSLLLSYVLPQVKAMSTASQSSLPFVCTICCENQNGNHLQIDNQAVCHECFRRPFELAIVSEEDYPAHWGTRLLSAFKWQHILGPTLSASYQSKEQEYSCPADQRIYCSRTDPPRRPDRCGNFMGRWRNKRHCVRCDKCMWYTCLRCADSFSPSDSSGSQTSIDHSCDPKREKEFEHRAFDGLKQGKDYQICPNEACKRKVELSHGCNYIRCHCRTSFCFICGQPVRDGNGHWRSDGGCPRFGQPGDGRAIYDDEDRYNDNDDITDDQRARELFHREAMMMPDWQQDARRAMDMQMRFMRQARAAVQAEEDMRQERAMERLTPQEPRGFWRAWRDQRRGGGDEREQMFDEVDLRPSPRQRSRLRRRKGTLTLRETYWQN